MLYFFRKLPNTKTMKRTERDWLTFCQKVWQFIRKHQLFHERQKVIAAVSGGIDSIVLLDFLLWAHSVKKIEVIVAHINHRLRGKESDGDEEFVRLLCKRHDIPFYSERVPTKTIAKETRRSVQETARDLRYAFFDTLKQSLSADCVATAHNANDNAETMLINLFRGSGIDGLGGIPVKRNAVVRPFLCVTRKEIEHYAQKKKLRYREDSSNRRDDYTRNYLRHHIIPNIERRLNPSLIETLTKTSDIVCLHSDFVESLLPRNPNNSLDASQRNEILLEDFNRLHPYLQQMMIHRLLVQHRIEPRYDIISTVLDLKDAQKGKSVDLDKLFVAERTADAIRIQPRTTVTPFCYTLTNEGTLTTEDFVFTIQKSAVPKHNISNNPFEEYVDAAAVKFPITVRSWKKGDVFIPLGMKGKKKLSDFFGEQKLTAQQKQSIPIIESGKTIMWIAGKRLDDRFKLTDATQETYHLTITFNDKQESRHQ